MNGFFAETNIEKIFKETIEYIEREFSHLAYNPMTHHLYDHPQDVDFPTKEKKAIWNKNTLFVIHTIIPNEEGSFGTMLTFENGNIGSVVLTKTLLYYQMPLLKYDLYLVNDNSWKFVSENENLESKLNQNQTLLKLVNEFIRPKEELFGLDINNNLAIFNSKWKNNNYIFLSNIPLVRNDKVMIYPDVEVDIINAIYSELLHL